MNNVKKILAPTDLSKLSLAGLRYAFSLARSFGAEVIVYHVINRDEIMQFSEQLKRFANPVAIGQHTENLLEESQEALSHFLRDNMAELLPVMKVQTKVEIGLPYKNIVERARNDGRLDCHVHTRQNGLLPHTLRQRHRKGGSHGSLPGGFYSSGRRT
jgi:nucleotide-binding universal stress UspA family protein